MKKFLNPQTFLFIYALLFLYFMSGCTKKEFTAFDDYNNSIPISVLELIKKQGYSTNGIVSFKDGYVIEGDIYITKADLTKTSKRSAIKQPMANSFLISGTIAQYRTTNLIGIYGLTSPRTITVSLAAGAAASSSAALDAALVRYNNAGIYLNFVRISGDADIDITIDNTIPWLGLASGFPDSGNPASGILINETAIGVNPDPGYLATLFAHEIGHCIGFRHSDYFDRSFSGCAYDSYLYNGYDEEAGSIGAIHIQGTPTSGDAGSWMLACIGTGVNRPFNTNDISALRYLYPVPYITFTLSTESNVVSGISLQIIKNGNTVATVPFPNSGTTSTTVANIIPGTYTVRSVLPVSSVSYPISILNSWGTEILGFAAGVNNAGPSTLDISSQFSLSASRNIGN